MRPTPDAYPAQSELSVLPTKLAREGGVKHASTSAST